MRKAFVGAHRVLTHELTRSSTVCQSMDSPGFVAVRCPRKGNGIRSITLKGT